MPPALSQTANIVGCLSYAWQVGSNPELIVHYVIKFLLGALCFVLSSSCADVVWWRLQGMAEPVEFIPWSWIPAVHQGDRVRAADLLWHELVSTGSSDFVHMWIWHRQNWLRGWALLLCIAYGAKSAYCGEKIWIAVHVAYYLVTVCSVTYVHNNFSVENRDHLVCKLQANLIFHLFLYLSDSLNFALLHIHVTRMHCLHGHHFPREPHLRNYFHLQCMF